jgi:hypothetical protein
VTLAFLYAVLQVLELVMARVAEGGRRLYVWASVPMGAAAGSAYGIGTPAHEWLRAFLGLIRGDRGDGMVGVPA